ncbi:MAG: exodeoxyribonuclease VII large subunit, partial [Bacteroides sp.]|nr:exodeoxyribonuclease VII large subunit [Bacteroides sp.]
ENLSQFDCVVIIRGGGSKADLESFNHYDLAYYITQFPLPVITGIGHERDESVADLVASIGLKTPTAVAEFLLDKFLAFEFRLSSYRDTLTSLVGRSVKFQQMRLERLASDLSHLSGAYLLSEREMFERMAAKLSQLSRAFVHRQGDKLERSQQRIRKGWEFRLKREQERLRHMEAKNELVNPVNVLRRGYSMTLHQGKLVKGLESIKAGEQLETRLDKGTVLSKVEKIIKRDERRKD